jgi:hypothetical protein
MVIIGLPYRIRGSVDLFNDDFLWVIFISQVLQVPRNSLDTTAESVIYSDLGYKTLPMDPWPLSEKVRLTLQIIVNFPKKVLGSIGIDF